MDKTIVFFDIDGTLVDDEKQMLATTKQAIKDLQRNGVHIAIATGRPPFMFQEIRDELDIDSYISFNGQQVVCNGEVIYENPLEVQALQKLHEDAIDRGHPMMLIGKNEMRATVTEHPDIKATYHKLLSSYPLVDPTYYQQEAIFQALLFCNEKEEGVIQKQHQDFHFLRWHELSCDIMPLGASKAIGMNKIIEAKGLKKTASYAFGDGSNDMELIKEAGTGIAMGNSIPELKEIADYTTKSVDEDGVLTGLQHFNLL
ncbi:MAG TPA: Cof-type HAD-IIB family hydrolase [Virgibacillus sp.]|nr:Cof-type HAD-IIB family hydrolase [Virgibacillus sp.]